MTRKLKVDTNLENGTLTFTPLNADGSKVDGVEPFVANVNDLSSAMQTQCMLHGMKQKLSDGLGKITEALAITESVSGVFSNLVDNNWSARGEGGVKLTQFFQDLVTVTGNTPENLIPWFKALSDVEQDQIRKSPDIAAAKTARVKLAADKAAKAAKAKAADAPATDLFAGIAG